MNTMNLADTPGYYYAIAYWLSALLIVMQNKKRIKSRGWWGVQLCFLIAITVLMTVTANPDRIFFLPIMALCIFILFLQIYTCADFTPTVAGYYCARAFICGEFTASLGWQIYFYSVAGLHLKRSYLTSSLLIAVVYAVVFAVFWFLDTKQSSDEVEIRITRRECFSAIILSAGIYLMSNLSYVYDNTPFSSRFLSEIYIIRTFVDLGGVAVLYAYHLQVKELQMKFEVDALQKMLQMQYANYQISQESIDMVNQKYHDLKHQIAVLRSEVRSEEKTDCLDRMEREIKIYETQNKTGNEVLDAILTSKSIYCQGQNISLTCVADGRALHFMDTIDISSLFGNAMDNAIESVRQIPEEESEKRLIHLSVVKQKGFVRIRVENYCEKEPVLKDGMPVTTKKDTRFHGYGLKSIQSTARKYGGSVTASVKNHWFELRILLPEKAE